MDLNHTNQNLVDNINNCTILDMSIEDALYDIILSTNNSLKDWFNNTVTLKYSINDSTTSDVANLTIDNSFFTLDEKAIWQPVFVNATTNEQKFSSNGLYNKNIIGTNEYISFTPLFQNNTFNVYGDHKMVIPWKLNRDDFPYECTEGLLFWIIKENTSGNPISYPNSLYWNNIPDYMPFYYETKGPYIKISEERLLIPILDGSNPDRLDIHKNYVIDNPSNVFAGLNYQTIPFSIDEAYGTTKESIKIWIPDGDVYSYKDYVSASNSEYKTYISSPLYQYYTAIYHAITIKRKRSFTRDIAQSRRYKNLAKYLASSPFITKFCINYMMRSDIQNVVQEYVIDNTINLKTALFKISSILYNSGDHTDLPKDYQLDVNKSNSIITRADQFFHKLKSKYGAKLSIKNASIYISKPLKYRDDIALTNTYEIYTKNARHFDSETSFAVLCQSIQANNYSINSTINGLTSYSNGTANDSDRAIEIFAKKPDNSYIKTNTVPLYDSIEPKWTSNTALNILIEKRSNTQLESSWSQNSVSYYYYIRSQSDRYPSKNLLNESFNPNTFPHISCKILTEINSDNESIIIDQEILYTDIYALAKKQFKFFWEQVSGPQIKFTDTNISDNELYDTSTSENVNIVVSDYAKYTIKCTIITPFGNYIKYKSFFFVDGDFEKINKYDIDIFGNNIKKSVTYTEDEEILNNFVEGRDQYYGPIVAETTLQSLPIILHNYKYKFIKMSGFKKVAINARGLVWPIDSEFQVARAGYLETYVEKLSGPIYKLRTFPSSTPFDIYHPEITRFRPLNITYYISSSDTSTRIYVDRIILENIRNGSSECSQCLSTFGSEMIGVTAFDGPGKKTLSVSRINNGFDLVEVRKNKPYEVLNYSYPDYSLDYSPPLYDYGRYTAQDTNKALTNSSSLTPLIKPDSTGKSFVLGIELPDIDITALNKQMPSITGYKLDWKYSNTDDEGAAPKYPYKLCYQKILGLANSGDIDRNFYVEFNKGVFYPNSGWISESGINATNRSHVLKFNPGARDSFAFNGPSIRNINDTCFGLNETQGEGQSVIRNEIIVPNIYSSSIELSIAPPVRWAPVCECPPGETATDAEREAFSLRAQQRIQENQIHKEYGDQLVSPNTMISSGTPISFKSFHGYRVLAGGSPKDTEPNNSSLTVVNDEFLYSRKSYSPKEGTASYAFTTVGPANKTTASESAFLRIPRVNNFQIKDLEVKLNFLNYINTQDLIVWLEVKPSDQDVSRMGNGTSSNPSPSPINTPYQFKNQRLSTGFQYKNPSIFWQSSVVDSNKLIDPTYMPATGVGNYLKNLINNNSIINPTDNLKLYLLNQEYIQNNQYNLSLKFSDHAHIYNTLNDLYSCVQDNNISFLNIEPQNIVENNSDINPSLAAMDYDEKDHAINSNIIKKNDLWITNNTFSKFYGKSLFLKPAAGNECSGGSKQQGPGLDSNSIFTLKIAVVDEPDIMDVYDNIKSAYLYTNFIQPQNLLTSSSMFNNLCKWELLLHTNDVPKHVPHSIDDQNYGNIDPLSLIDYYLKPHSSGIEPSGYYGYNFIADLTDKQFLLPLANINAPYAYVQDNDMCVNPTYSPVKSSVLLNPPMFPTSAVISIVAGITLAGGFLAGVGLAGVGAATDTFINGSSGYDAIINYFGELRRWKDLDRKLGQIYNVGYNNYPYGSPEKVLLNVSIDGCFWYNVEAAIFRLNNTPTASLRKIKPILLNKINEPETNDEKITVALSEFSYSLTTFKELYQLIIDSLGLIKYNTKLSCSEILQYQNTNSLLVSGTVKTLSIGDIFTVDRSFISEDEPNCNDVNGDPAKIGTFILEKSIETTNDEYIWKPITNKEIVNNNYSYLNLNASYFISNISETEQLLDISNSIPYDIIDVGDEIEIFSSSKRDRSCIFIVSSKNKILIDNVYHTIMFAYIKDEETLPIDNTNTGQRISSDNFIKSCDTIRNNSKNIIAIVNPVSIHTTPLNSNNSFDQGRFDLDSSIFDGKLSIIPENLQNSLVPQIYFSTNSTGSYGNISPKVRKNFLHYMVHMNKFKKITDLLNNTYNHKKKYNTIWYGNTEYESTIMYNSGFYGYTYGIDYISQSKTELSESNNYVAEAAWSTTDQDNLETLISTSSYNIVSNNNKKEIIYLKSNSFSTLYNSVNNNTKYIWIEGLIDPFTPIKCDSVDTNRIQTLDADINNDILLQYSGRIDDHQAFFNTYPSILTAVAYYDSVSDLIDSVSRIDKLNIILNKISMLYEERNALVMLNQCPQAPSNGITNISYKILLENNTNNSNIYKIEKQVNDNYYWIHIDPKQSCSISEELRPKVLKSTKYNCAYLDPNININLISNNICPRDAESSTRGVENFDPFSAGIGGDVPNTTPTFRYDIPQSVIDEKKADWQGLYPDISVWAEQKIFRTFYMNATEEINSIATNPDYIVYVEETYDVAVPPRDTKTVADAIAARLILNDGSADTNIVPGFSETCAGGLTPGGIGLLNSNGDRYGGPSRICNIFNLDNIDKIKVKFRKIPRILRGIDLLSTIFRFSPKAQYRQATNGNPLQPLETTIGQGTLNNNIYIWECLEMNSANALVYTSPPDLMKIMNEMTFRAFFGSADGLENRDQNILYPEYSHQLIPFEFFTEPKEE